MKKFLLVAALALFVPHLKAQTYGNNSACSVPTTATASSGSTTLTVPAAIAPAIIAGASVTGTGIPAGDTVSSVSGTTVTLATATTAALSNTAVTFTAGCGSSNTPLSAPQIGADAAGLAATEQTRAAAAEGLALQKSANLSDLASPATARTSLGLGSAATQPSSAFDVAGSGGLLAQMLTTVQAPGNLVGLYLVDATDFASGTTLYDHSGNGNNCTLATGTNAPTIVQDGVGYAVSWPQANSNQANVISCPGITGPATMMAVVNYVNPQPVTGSNLRRTLFGYSTTANSVAVSEISLSYQTGIATTANLYSVQPSTAYTTNMPTGNGYNLVTVALNSTANAIYLNGVPFSSLSGTGATPIPSGGYFEVGGSQQSNCGSGYCPLWAAKVRWIAVYSVQEPAQVILANQSAVSAYFSRTYGINLGSTPTVTNPVAVPFTVDCGLTSIEAGTGGGEAPCKTMSLGSNYAVNITGIPSSTAAQHGSSGFAFENTFFNPLSENILLMDSASTNDLCISSGLTGAQAWGVVAHDIVEAELLGFKVGVGTVISRSGTGTGGTACDTLANNYNTLARQNAASLGAFLIDLAEVPGLSPNGSNSTNPSALCSGTANCYYTDHVHLTVAGETTHGVADQNAILANTGFTQSYPDSQAGSTYTMTEGDRWLNAPITAASTFTLPDCTALTGYDYHIFNTSSSFTLTMAGGTSQPISGSTSVGANTPSTFVVQLTSPTAGGCSWLRTQ